MLESLLMRAFWLIYSSDFDGDDDRCLRQSGKSSSSGRRAFMILASVCWDWYHTLTGWPDSPTGQWVRHQLTKIIQRECVILPVYINAYRRMYYMCMYAVCIYCVCATISWKRRMKCFRYNVGNIITNSKSEMGQTDVKWTVDSS